MGRSTPPSRYMGQSTRTSNLETEPMQKISIRHFEGNAKITLLTFGKSFGGILDLKQLWSKPKIFPFDKY